MRAVSAGGRGTSQAGASEEKRAQNMSMLFMLSLFQSFSSTSQESWFSFVALTAFLKAVLKALKMLSADASMAGLRKESLLSQRGAEYDLVRWLRFVCIMICWLYAFCVLVFNIDGI